MKYFMQISIEAIKFCELIIYNFLPLIKFSNLTKILLNIKSFIIQVLIKALIKEIQNFSENKSVFDIVQSLNACKDNFLFYHKRFIIYT